MAYTYGFVVAGSAAHTATASGLCLTAPYIKVSPESFSHLVNSMFTIVHVRKGSHHFYFGRILDRFVVYTRSPFPLTIQVDVEAEKLSKTIGV